MYNYIEPTIEKFVFEKLGLDITKKDDIYEQSNGKIISVLETPFKNLVQF